MFRAQPFNQQQPPERQLGFILTAPSIPLGLLIFLAEIFEMVFLALVFTLFSPPLIILFIS